MKKELLILINSKGYNVQSLAKKCGVQRNTIYSFGRGVGSTNISTVRKIAEVLGFKPSELLAFMGE